MKIFLKETRIGVRVFGDDGYDYTVASPLDLRRSVLDPKTRWDRLSTEEQAEIKRLNFACSFGKAKK